MMDPTFSCSANEFSAPTPRGDDLETCSQYLATPSMLSLKKGHPATLSHHPSTPRGQKSLFDEALCDANETITTTASHRMEQDQPRSPGSSSTPPFPKPCTGPIPIPIQHCAHGSSLQRPAIQFSNGDDSVEVAVEQEVRPQSLNQLITAIKIRQTTNTDANLQRRLHDFERARYLRRDRFQMSPPWGIMGMEEHLSGIRVDLRWAEQCALRRANGENYIGWADFVKENASSHYYNRPYFIMVIILLSTAMMIYTMSLANWKFAPLDVNPMIGPPPQALLDAGALNSYLLIVKDEWWRLFAPLVLHAGIIHFVCNMLAIWFIGGPLEKIHGFYNIACLFIISAVGGNILSALFQPHMISVGASGGIFGLVGVCLADVFVNWDLLFLRLEENDEKTKCNHIQVIFWLFFDIIINVVIGLTPFVDNYAHLGGLFYGIFYALPLVDRLGIHFFGQLGFCFRVQNCSLRLFGFLAGCSLLLVSSLLLMKSDGYTSPCESCRYISCAPFPFWKEEKWWDCST